MFVKLDRKLRDYILNCAGGSDSLLLDGVRLDRVQAGARVRGKVTMASDILLVEGEAGKRVDVAAGWSCDGNAELLRDAVGQLSGRETSTSRASWAALVDLVGELVCKIICNLARNCSKA